MDNYNDYVTIHDLIEIELKKIRAKFEVWKIIDGYDNYLVSNFGNIKNGKNNRFMNPGNNRVYKLINLYKNGIGKTFRVHRLVAKAFLENPDKKPDVDHIDQNPTNNNAKNLRWATSKNNQYNQGKRKDNSSGFKGVTFQKSRQKYCAKISINGKSKHLGLFESAEEAGQVYDAKAKQIHGEFYYKNK